MFEIAYNQCIMEKDDLELSRFRDLANRAYQKNIYTYTDFLSLADLAVFMEHERDFGFISHEINGGYEEAERVMVRFGSEDELGYEEAYPITLLRIAPLQSKFADDLTHRDFLGSLMNLGIERDVLGDILINEKCAYLFCKESVADYIIDSLSRVKHTSVMITREEALPDIMKKEPVETSVQIPSERIDALVAKVYHISREDSISLFREKRVFVNGRIIENNSGAIKPGDSVTVRGFGKFNYKGMTGLSKKGKVNAIIEKY